MYDVELEPVVSSVASEVMVTVMRLGMFSAGAVHGGGTLLMSSHVQRAPARRGPGESQHRRW